MLESWGSLVRRKGIEGTPQQDKNSQRLLVGALLLSEFEIFHSLSYMLQILLLVC